MHLASFHCIGFLLFFLFSSSPSFLDFITFDPTSHYLVCSPEEFSKKITVDGLNYKLFACISYDLMNIDLMNIDKNNRLRLL
jgi:hypothetical protein